MVNASVISRAAKRLMRLWNTTRSACQTDILSSLRCRVGSWVFLQSKKDVHLIKQNIRREAQKKRRKVTEMSGKITRTNKLKPKKQNCPPIIVPTCCFPIGFLQYSNQANWLSSFQLQSNKNLREIFTRIVFLTAFTRRNRRQFWHHPWTATSSELMRPWIWTLICIHTWRTSSSWISSRSTVFNNPAYPALLGFF